MMLQKTSFRIKRFITQRRNQSTPDLGVNYDEARFSDLKLSISSPKRLSWLSEAPSTEVIALRRTNSNTTVRSHHIHQSGTAHSSSSSLCSCDCNENPVPIEQSLSRVKSATVRPEILYLPPALPTNASDDAKSWRLIFPESLPRSSSLTAASKIRIATPPSLPPIIAADLFETATYDHDNDRTPTQSVKYISQPDMEDFSNNVEQLIRETDEAFKAVGTALADAKAATQEWYDTKSTLVAPKLSISRGIMRKSRSPVPASPTARSPIAKIKPTPLAATGKAKRHRKSKSNLFNRASGSTPPPLPVQSDTPARWTLNDVTANMVDVFSGRRFRLEADEMLTPMRIQKLKEQVAAEEERRKSAESSRSSTSYETDGDDDFGTPTDPFYLDTFGKTGGSKEAASPPPPPPAFTSPRPPPPVTQVNKSVATASTSSASSKDSELTTPVAPPQAKAGMIFNDYSFPAPPLPPKNPRRPSAVPLLPTISEVSPLNLSPTQFFAQSGSVAEVVEKPRSPILLPSTNFSMLSPLFKHGSIRIERILKPRKDKSLSPDEEGLDWVAFQMAISGNMDEYSHDVRSDSEWELDEVEHDEIEAWWNSLGLELGGLQSSLPMDVKSAVVEIRKSKPLPIRNDLREKRADGIYKAAEEQLIKTWRAEIDTNKIVEEVPREEVDTNKFVINERPRAAAPRLMPPPVIEVRRPSVAESMPDSPMLDLGRVSPLKDGDIIPMGFNLGHDLGDFLQWETNHVQMFMGDER
ncbi:uncharacterized protein LY89DRAFT_15720 [Mollisia scopiformis]|uniref:Uncharacterized protein n=1 Tax=Mollisia scopiformis TaxID=149040 RepID=A0A194XWV9_MOLSC|nr:uncharacterized protein LY89DRAFT_15720 [Mollisia scopiformis]KUJ24237.1 hypothetical protein LY89DRAFT_15720 [Mollisia scopiformis]